jgi:hypothetical protein
MLEVVMSKWPRTPDSKIHQLFAAGGQATMRNTRKTNHRFVVRNNRLVDTLNLTDDLLAWYESEREERLLRDRALELRLRKLVEKLFGNNAQRSIEFLIMQIIRASQLNAFDIEISIKHRFIGGRSALKRKKNGNSAFTSLQLFIDDFECLLRDLYGDVESEAMERILLAVSAAVDAQSWHIAPELCKERADARTLDDGLGIGLSEYVCFSVSDLRGAFLAKPALMRRARDVLANPSAFSEYTVEFAKRFSECWDCNIEAEDQGTVNPTQHSTAT